MLSNLFTRPAKSLRESSPRNARAFSRRAADRRYLFLEQLESRRVLATVLSLAATDAVKQEGSSGTTAFTFTVTRSDDLSGTTSVEFTTAGSGTNQASGPDFIGGSLPAGTVNFAAGESTQTITLNVVGDAVAEQDEEFTVTLSNPSSPATISTATATGTIQNDDGAVPTTTLAIAATDASKLEGSTGSTAFTFTVTRSDDTSGATSVEFAVTGSGTNQASGPDFIGGSLPAGTVNFAAGETTQTITLNVVGDAVAEPDEGFTVTLSNPSAPATISTATASGTIQNDDGAVPTTTLAIAATDASKLEGNTGSTAFTFTVTRSDDTSGATSVEFAVTGSGTNQASGPDFVGGAFPTGTVNFAAGETTQTITVNVVGDAVAESDEGFTVTLSNPSAPATISTATAQGLIQNDDGAVGGTTLAIAATDASKPEGNTGSTAFTFTVTRSDDTTGATSVEFAVTGSGTNQANGTDFVGGAFPTGTVNFAAGETTQTITLNVVGDAVAESDEGFTVTLSNPSAPATISTATASGTIQNDDGAVGGTTLAIAATDASKLEGNTGSTAFTFTVTRSDDTSGATSVEFAVTGSGTNQANGTDFVGSAFPIGTVNFAAGETTQTITVNVVGDTTAEPDEGFTVTLSNPSAPATISTATASGTIQNDDGAVGGTTLAIAATDATKLEGNTGSTAFTFTVTRSGNTTGTSSVNFAISGSGASPAAGSDFTGGTLPIGTVNFAAGQVTQTITVNVNGDLTVEPDDGFSVTLSNPSSPATITTATAQGTILNDDGAVGGTTLAIAATDATNLEGDAGSTAFTFTVTRSGDTTGTSSVNFATAGSGGSPATGSDFAGGTLPSGTVNFAAGQTTQTITVNVSGDLAVESDEGFTITLSGASSPATISTATAQGTILNDDDEVQPPPGIEIETANVPGDSGTAEVGDDADNPGQGVLVVTGTSRGDVIIVEPRPGNRSQIRVRRNGKVIGNFDSSEVQSIVVFGQGGNDTIIVNSRLSIPAMLFGESGNDLLFGGRGDDSLDGGAGNDRLFGMAGRDRLVGGSGNDLMFGGQGNDQLFGQEGRDSIFGESGDDIVVGGDGNDRIFGGSGRDLLIGGGGADTMFGASHDDILVSDSTAHDDDEEALVAILAEWTSSNNYQTRVNNLRDGGGENGAFTLNDSTVFEDGARDTLFGQGGQDWFLFGSGDKLRDRARNELVG